MKESCSKYLKRAIPVPANQARLRGKIQLIRHRSMPLFLSLFIITISIDNLEPEHLLRSKPCRPGIQPSLTTECNQRMSNRCVGQIVRADLILKAIRLPISRPRRHLYRLSLLDNHSRPISPYTHSPTTGPGLVAFTQSTTP